MVLWSGGEVGELLVEGVGKERGADGGGEVVESEGCVEVRNSEAARATRTISRNLQEQKGETRREGEVGCETHDG